MTPRLSHQVEDDPEPTLLGAEWVCNACQFRTVLLPAAKQHAEANGNPFDHLLYERLREGTSRPARRIHKGPDGKAVVLRRGTRT